MNKNCLNCQSSFEITDKDLSFYERMSSPLPTFCPPCRQQRRFAWRNERNLYKRKCDKTGENIISIYSTDKPLKVYSPKAWWGDSWDGMDYGQNFDFNRPFFEQFEELMNKVPHISLWNWQSENSEYTHCSYANKNCYMHINTDHSLDSYYNYMSDNLKDCIDCTAVWGGELLIECLDSENLYFSRYCQNCKSSDNLSFCLDCIGCSHCLLCTNLRNKQYWFNNKQLSKEEYELRFNNLFFDSLKIEEYKSELIKLSKTTPRRENKIINSENCMGNYITDSKNAYYCFDVWNAQDIRYCTYVAGNVKDTYDAYAGTKLSNCLEVMSGEGLDSSKFINWINNGPHNSEYSMLCVNNCSNLFGCIGLKSKKFCILNKQYCEEDYYELKDRIIKHMKNLNEYGEFFPVSISPFGYNETIANEYYPLSEKEAISMGYRWKTEVESDKGSSPYANASQDKKGQSSKEISICKVTGKPFRIISQERELYGKLKVDLPTRCPNQRHLDRITKRNPRKLWTRKCMKCEKEIKTTYSPATAEAGSRSGGKRPEIVYCEKCFEETVD